MAATIREKIRRILRRGPDRATSGIKRRRKVYSFLWNNVSYIWHLMLVAGFAWMLAVPSRNLGRNTYIDENALQPGQVNTNWNWPDVYRADRYLDELENLRATNASSQEHANYITNEFRKLGIPSATQDYSFLTTTGISNGTNAYAVLSSPRTSGAEAILISASRISRTGEGDGSPNLRGIATVLSLAAYLKRYSLWAKDLIFVISDNYLEGMQAWITKYHGLDQSNLQADPLKLPSGVIWTALNIDYPGHSFSHLGIFFEGLNGRLPNQDLINSFSLISIYTGNVPVLLYDHRDPREVPHLESQFSIIPSWVPPSIRRQDAVREYGFRAKNILRHVGYQARGQASGVHGLLHRFRIDAFTIFAVPANGPHGFHAIGRIVESTLRTMNNLLERLHASFFFYLLVLPATFLKIGSYLPSAVLIGTALLFAGLDEWSHIRWYQKPADRTEDAKAENHDVSGTTSWVERPRPVLHALLIALSTHLAGAGVFYIRTRTWAIRHAELANLLLFATTATLPWLASAVYFGSTEGQAPLSRTLRSFMLFIASMAISITSVLNFSLAATLAVALGLSLPFASTSLYVASRFAKYTIYILLGSGWLLFTPGEVQKAIWNWELLGVWFAPFVCIVYTPLVLQAAIVSLLPPQL
ncbi:Gaa1-domain-containing protein [Panus rudis PR-1116 ss-1]|nr:Gaa1-domain-containing protein [Panus rudis PR-1116 ss-1]